MRAPPLRSGWRRFATPADLERFGAAVGALVAPGEAVCLYGPLGAGKSTLARGLVRALTTPDEEVPSPTFTLVQPYQTARFSLAHFDLYRLKTAEEAWEAGLEEALDIGAAVVEWSERLDGALPPQRLELELSRSPPEGDDAGADGRWARWRGVGAWEEKAMRLAD